MPRELYIKFNRLLGETAAPYRDPEDYIIEHLREVVERHEDWKRKINEIRSEGDRMNSESYKHGVEDSVELCLFKISKAKILRGREKLLKEIWSLIKEDKIERIKRMLWLIER